MSRKAIIHYTEAEARDFFERLATYSVEYVRVALPQVHKHWPTHNNYDAWRKDGPIGHVLHYTAGVHYSGTIRHFVFGNRASTQWVIAKALDRRFDDLRKDLELDGALYSEAVQMIPPTQPAWHAGWVNRFLAGTEIRNAGVLRPYPKKKGKPGQRSMSRAAFFEYAGWDVDDLNFFWWYEGWTREFKGEVLEVNGSWWESFSRGSIATAITILRYLNSLYPGALEPVWMLAHHQTNARKNDIVLPVDLDLFREAVIYSSEHVDDLEWLAAYDDEEDGFEDVDDPWMLRELDENQADRPEEDLDDFDPYERIAKVTGRIDSVEEGQEALRRLGYYVATDEAIATSTRTYQRSRDLGVDADIGPITLGALDRDLRQWRLR
jgi:hypothetical protein